MMDDNMLIYDYDGTPIYYDYDGKPITSLLEWHYLFREPRHVGKDEHGDILVSTVWLGLNHRFGPGKPLIYETMIFKGEHDEYTMRYSSYDEAKAGHRQACKLAFGIDYEPEEFEGMFR